MNREVTKTLDYYMALPYTIELTPIRMVDGSRRSRCWKVV